MAKVEPFNGVFDGKATINQFCLALIDAATAKSEKSKLIKSVRLSKDF